jgi:MoxR-like ATPase
MSAAPHPGNGSTAAGPMVDAEDVRRRLDALDYLVDDGMATALYLALTLEQPLLLEGEPGVGKTTAAKALARALEVPLIRLQCYEGLTASEALYEWNYQRQLLAIRLAEARHETLADADLFTEEFLQERPILKAIRTSGALAPVLLIDEIDRADDEFEALLFEFLGESSITIPEIGTFVAARPPVVVLTSNRSRELHDALRRRCLYHWIDFPGPARVAEILRRSVPAASEPLIASAADFIGRVRSLDLDKAPGMAETIDWVSALNALGVASLSGEGVVRTLSAVAKTPDDRTAIGDALSELQAVENRSAHTDVEASSETETIS